MKDVNSKVPATLAPSETIVLEKKEPDPVHVYALNPQQMKSAQQNLIGWAKQKIDLENQNFLDLSENLTVAAKNKWRTSTLKRHTEIARKKIDFYKKIKAALEAGYIVIPGFPIDAFAVRVRRNEYSPKELPSRYNRAGHFQDADILPEGKGEYASSTPKKGTRSVSVTENGKEVWKTEYFAENWQNVEFPVAIVKPEVMNATQKALSEKIFDEIGLAGERKKDPIVIGRIYDPTAVYRQKFLTFFIAWWLDTSTL